MVNVARTNANDKDFLQLVTLLDAELAIRDGDDAPFYAQFNKTGTIPYAVVAYHHNVPAGCGALRPYEGNTAEVKRMYVLPAQRRMGIAATILRELEAWASELSYENLVLETGIVQPEAVALYKKHGYQVIPNYGQYAGIGHSICFGKKLSP